MTVTEYFEDQKRRGYNKKQALLNYETDVGLGLKLQEPKQNMYRSFQNDLYSNATEEQKQFISNVLDPEEANLRRMQAYYTDITGIPKTLEMTKLIIAKKYPNVDSYTEVARQEIRKGGKLAERYLLHHNRKNPFGTVADFLKLTMGKTSNNLHDVGLGLLEMGLNPTLQKIATPFKSKEEIQKNIDNDKTRKIMIESIKESKKFTEDFYTSNIPNYIKNSAINDPSNVASEFLMLPFYMIPGVGVPARIATIAGFNLGRYYDSSLEEYRASGLSEEKAHNRALGYTVLFGSLAVGLDAITAGTGSKIFKAISQGAGKGKARKIIAGMQAKQAANEFVTETLEGAALEYDTTGNVTWNEQLKSGGIGAIVAILGVELSGKVGSSRINHISDRLIAEGFTEQEIKDLNVAYLANDTETIENLNKTKNDRNAEGLGERLALLTNPERYASNPEVNERPLSIGDFRWINGHWREERNNNGDLYKNIDEYVKDTFEPEMQDAAKLAIEMPSAENTEEYNAVLEDIQSRETEQDPTLNEDPDVELDINPIEIVNKINTEIQALTESINDPDSKENKSAMITNLTLLLDEKRKIIEENPDLTFPRLEPKADEQAEIASQPEVETIESLQKRQDQLNEQAKNIENKQSDEYNAILFEIQQVANRKKILENEAIINDPNASNSDKAIASFQLKTLFEDRRKNKKKNAEPESKQALEADLEYYESLAILYENWSSVNPDADIFKTQSAQSLIEKNKENAQYIREDLAEMETETVSQPEVEVKTIEELIEEVPDIEELIGDNLIEEQNDFYPGAIEKPTSVIVPKEIIDHVNTLNDTEFIDYVADLIVNKEPVSEQIQNILGARFGNASHIAINQAKAKAASIQKQMVEEPVGADPYANNNNAYDLLDYAFVKMEENLINKPKSYWLKRADKIIEGAQKKAQENNKPMPKMDREVEAERAQFEDTRARASYLRKELSDSVQSGNLSDVKYVLGREGIPEDYGFGQNIIKATELFRSASRATKGNIQYPTPNVLSKVDDLDNFIDSIITKQYEDAAEYSVSFANKQQALEMQEIIEKESFEDLVNYVENDIYGSLPESNAEVDAMVDAVIRKNYESMSRKDLQKEAKSFGIKANDKSSVIIDNILNARKAEQIAEDDVLLPEDPIMENFTDTNLTLEQKDIIKQNLLRGKLESKTLEIADQFIARLGLRDLDITPEEGMLAMQYLANKQDYDPSVEPVDKKRLNPRIVEMIDEWDTVAKDIADKLTDFADELNIDFTAIQGLYFPMRHGFGANVQDANMLDATLETFGRIRSKRRGKFEGVIKDPIKQLMGSVDESGYLQDAAKILAYAELIAERKKIILDSPAETARRLFEYNQLEPEEKIKTPKPREVIAIEELKELERAGEKLGIERTGATDIVLFDLINEHQNSDTAQDIFTADFQERIPENLRNMVNPALNKIGQGWANSIDPVTQVPWMDGADLRNIVNGEIYGANTKLYSRVLRDTRNMTQANYKIKQEQAELLKPIRWNLKAMQALDELLSKHLLDDIDSKKFLFHPSGTPKAQEIQNKLGVSKYEAELLEWYRDRMLDAKINLLRGQDLRSDLSFLEREKRIEFYDLEQRIREGTATEADILSYKAFDPSNDILQDPNNKDAIAAFTRRKLRNLSRWFFEEVAIDNRNFFAYFESAIDIGNKGTHLHDTATLMSNWANYLESIGQTRNAQWWRDRVEYSVKGNLFKWEDSLLDILSKTAYDVKSFALGKDLNEGLMDGIRNKSVKDIKSDFVKVMARWQQFLITKNLNGNVGWIPTQTSSYTLVAPTAMTEEGIIDAIKSQLAGVGGVANKITREQVKELSSVSGIKGVKRRDILQAFSFEDTGVYADSAIKRTARKRFREGIGSFASSVESGLTDASYIAGYSAGIKAGLNEDQAMIHGDLVAAQSQVLYDQVNRNMALNSKFGKALFPFMSFTYGAWSLANRMAGKTGVQMSRKAKAKAIALYMAQSKVLWTLLTMAFGDDLLKALFNPTYSKFTPGSFIPLAGKTIDIKISELLPWVDDKTWMKDGMLTQMTKRFGRVLSDYIEGKPNANRNAAYFFTSYILPGAGVPGSIAINNFLRMHYASQDNYEFLDVNGKKYAEFEDPTAIRWVTGTAFGVKAVDKPESLIKNEE